MYSKKEWNLFLKVKIFLEYSKHKIAFFNASKISIQNSPKKLIKKLINITKTVSLKKLQFSCEFTNIFLAKLI